MDGARTLGKIPNDHAQFEERTLFEMLATRLEEDEFMALGQAVLGERFQGAPAWSRLVTLATTGCVRMTPNERVAPTVRA